MSALNKLAHLSLVNKVTTELENHIGIGDKTLSEFVIDLADKHSEPRSFQKALDEVGAELSFDLVRNLLEMIQRMRPKAGSKSDGERTAGGAASGSRARPTADDPLPGLSVRDDEARAKALTREIYGDNPITANMADDPALLEASRRSRDGGTDRARGRDGDGDRRGGDRSDDWRRDRSRDRSGGASSSAVALRAGEPEIGQIYRGRVSNVLDFGAFVELTEFRGKHEGLVHASVMSAKKGVSAREQVRANQPVWVKVTTRSSTRMALSMRDVDQSTGQDLVGRGASGSASAASAVSRNRGSGSGAASGWSANAPPPPRAHLCAAFPASSSRRRTERATSAGAAAR